MEVGSAAVSDDCGVEYEDLCTGDATMACGGDDAIAVYQRTGAPSPVPVPTASADDDASDTPSPVLETPAPVDDTPAPSPAPDASTPSPVQDAPTPSPGSYSLEGCFNDFKDSRLMEGKTTMDVVSAEVGRGLHVLYEGQVGSELVIALPRGDALGYIPVLGQMRW